MNPGIQFDRKLIGKTYLITGASGFIGGRIVERICRDYNGKVKAIVHNLGHAARIARFDIEILQGNILDRSWLLEVTKNVDYVVHCAFGNTSDIHLNHKITVEGTRNILDAVFKNKIKRFIHFSTMSVYGSPLPKYCDENTDHKIVKGDFYNNDKIAAEQVIDKYIEKGLPVVVLQPTVVYGPYASVWTQWIVNMLRQNQLFLIEDGNGLANPVFIDNIVDAVFLSMIKDEAVGKKFIISDGKAITWKEFFYSYQHMINKNAIPQFKLLLKYKYLFITSLIDITKKMKDKIYPGTLFKTQNTLTRSFDNLSHETEKMKSVLLDENLLLFFKDRCIFKVDKAEKILKYYPRISFKKGMELTQRWLKYSRLI